MTAGVLFVCVELDAERLAKFDDWYDQVHLPGRMTVPGFRGAWRLRGAGGGSAAATACIYKLESTAVLHSEAYLALQGQTADDTASHLSGLMLHRIVGSLLPGSPHRLGDLHPVGTEVRASLERSVIGDRWQTDGKTSIYEIENDDRKGHLLLKVPADYETELAPAGGFATWHLSLISAHPGVTA